MKGIRTNVKEKSILSKHVRMKKRKEISMNSKCVCDDALKSRNPNSTGIFGAHLSKNKQTKLKQR